MEPGQKVKEESRLQPDYLQGHLEPSGVLPCATISNDELALPTETLPIPLRRSMARGSASTGLQAGFPESALLS